MAIVKTEKTLEITKQDKTAILGILHELRRLMNFLEDIKQVDLLMIKLFDNSFSLEEDTKQIYLLIDKVTL